MNSASLFCRCSLFGAFIFIAAGCADLCRMRDPNSGRAIPQEFEGAVALVKHRKAILQPAVLRSVRTASCPAGFDRVVFEFEARQTPGYEIEYVDRPIRRCGSGEVVPVAGDAWLKVSLMSAEAHTVSGRAIENRDRALNYPNLRQLVQTCDFESEVCWVLGLGSPKPFRVVELSHPPRIVIDVKH